MAYSAILVPGIFFAIQIYDERFIYSMFTKDTLDEKAQARDTRVHVTL